MSELVRELSETSATAVPKTWECVFNLQSSLFTPGTDTTIYMYSNPSFSQEILTLPLKLQS